MTENLEDPVAASAAATQSEEGISSGRRPPIRGKGLLAGLLLAITLHATAELAVAVILPMVSRELDGLAFYGAAVSAYLIGNIIALVWSGQMTDAHGPSMPFNVGLGAFALGSLIAVFAQDMEVFVFARFVQGLGGGVFSAIVFASTNKFWNRHERPHILALLSAAWILPGLIVPMVAGAVAELSSWRFVFVALLPLTLATGLLTRPGMARLGPGIAHDKGHRRIAEAILLATAVTLILYAISRPFGGLAFAMILLGLVLAARPLQNLMPPGAGDQRRALLGAIAIKFALVFAFFGVEAFLPLALIELHHMTAFAAGFILTLASLSWSAAAFLQANLSARYSPRRLVGLGLALIGVTITGLLFLLSPATPSWISYVAWALSGAGIGITWNTLAASTMANTLPGKEGATSTATGVSESLGIALAGGIGGAIVNFGERTDLSLSYSIGAIWILCIVVVGIAIIGTWFFVERTPHGPHQA